MIKFALFFRHLLPDGRIFLRNLLLNVGFKKFYVAFNPYLLGGGREEEGIAGAQYGGLSGFVGDGAFAAHADEDDETVKVAVVDGHRLVDVVNSGGEVGALHQLHTLVLQR